MKNFLAVSALLFLIAKGSLGNSAGDPKMSNADMVLAIERGESYGILRAGATGDRSFVPLLKQKLTQKRRTSKEARESIRLALAKLGDREQLQDLFCEMQVESYGWFIDSVSRKLPYVNGWFSARVIDGIVDGKFGQFLDYSHVPNDISTVSVESYALRFSTKVFPKVPRVPPSGSVTRESWKHYLLENEDTLRKMEPTGEGVDFSPKACKKGHSGK